MVLNLLLEDLRTGAADPKKTALDILRRATNLSEAVNTLDLPYTYDIIRVDRSKREARRQLGSMSSEILTDIRDQMIDEAVRMWLRGRGLTIERVDAIFMEVANANTAQKETA